MYAGAYFPAKRVTTWSESVGVAWKDRYPCRSRCSTNWSTMASTLPIMTRGDAVGVSAATGHEPPRHSSRFLHRRAAPPAPSVLSVIAHKTEQFRTAGNFHSTPTSATTIPTHLRTASDPLKGCPAIHQAPGQGGAAAARGLVERTSSPPPTEASRRSSRRPDRAAPRRPGPAAPRAARR